MSGRGICRAVGFLVRHSLNWYFPPGVLGGAIPPLLAPGLAASSGSIGVMLSVCGVIAVVCTWALTETRGRAMAHEQQPRTQADPVC